MSELTTSQFDDLTGIIQQTYVTRDKLSLSNDFDQNIEVETKIILNLNGPVLEQRNPPSIVSEGDSEFKVLDDGVYEINILISFFEVARDTSYNCKVFVNNVVVESCNFKRLPTDRADAIQKNHTFVIPLKRYDTLYLQGNAEQGVCYTVGTLPDRTNFLIRRIC